MIKAEDIYKVTNNGLDIILHYYPQARDCVGTNRHFKRRPDNALQHTDGVLLDAAVVQEHKPALCVG